MKINKLKKKTFNIILKNINIDYINFILKINITVTNFSFVFINIYQLNYNMKTVIKLKYNKNPLKRVAIEQKIFFFNLFLLSKLSMSKV